VRDLRLVSGFPGAKRGSWSFSFLIDLVKGRHPRSV
jgi:hypothetical protein